MLGGIFHKRKKAHELRTPSLQDLKKFRDAYAKYAELRHVETPPCFEKSIYKAIAGQKELHSVEFRQEDITDPQMIALAEALLEMPIVSSLDLRDNRITDDVRPCYTTCKPLFMVNSRNILAGQEQGAKALLEVLRLQIIAAKTPPTIDQRTKQPLYPPMPEYTRYVTNVNLKGNEVSASVLQELSQYMDVLRREDKRLEIRAALNRIDRNSDGSIDEDEFKGVLKLLTASTPTKKEMRAFMQQHTLSTDSAQNVVNLENVLLAKCATSPSRHSACPPWEALVQQRHSLLGAPRMASAMLSSLPPEPSSASPSKARLSRPSLPSSGSGLGVNPFIHSNSAPDVSPLSSPASQYAPVAPVDMANATPKPPPAPAANVSVTPQQPQYAVKSPDSKTLAPSLPPDHSTPFTRPPTIPILPLASVARPPVSPSPRSARSSVDDDGQRNSALSREGGPSSVTSAPASPHDSDISDSMSVVSSAFGGSVSLRGFEEHEHSNVPERKPNVAPSGYATQTAPDSPRWQSEHFSGGDDEGASTGALSGTQEEAEKLSSGDADDDARSGYSHRTAKSVVPSGSSSNEVSDHKSVSNLSRLDASFPGNDTPRELLARGSEHSSIGHEEKRSLPGSVVSTPRFEDLSSLVYRGPEEGGRPALASSNLDKVDTQPEEDEEVDEHMDSLVFDVTKDGKERYVMKLLHSEFRSGLAVKDFPSELPFRNLLALLLPDNGLSDLALLAECRFPFVTVLDLARNKLTKLRDDGLIAFPRLEVLNLADNHLKSIAGLAASFKLRALGLSGNAIRTVKNVEHLVQLEILQLANNQIATVHALRLLSLNKVLAHLTIDGNPVVETDERQKRKNIVHVRNLLPALQSLGSIPCAGLHSKDKNKPNTGSTSPGTCLFESDLMPDYKTLWVSTACDTLHIVRDATPQTSASSQHDGDEWDTRDEDGERPKKPLTREQQRQKDELRSRAIGFRSRGKAIPSPPKAKTSVFCFGPPQPPTKRKKKKPAPADPGVVREQQRRASELSAPKHAPVDKSLMHQEQKRKSRVDFHGAMTVGERLQLARDMTQRRPTATIGLSARSRSILEKADSRKRASIASATIGIGTGPESAPTTASRSPSPQRPSPIKDAMVFRIDPTDTPRSPKGVLTFRVDPYPSGGGGQAGSPKANGSKEAGFLHDLAVSDFLNHAEEEFSTALTALNVLLSMSEKEQGDRKKLADYRASLDALDILNEHESHELYEKAQGHPENELEVQCTEWFTKLGVVKKCMRQLLEKLEAHAPGSGVIRAYCRYIRSNELRGIITAMLEDQDDARNQPTAGVDADKDKKDAPLQGEEDSPQPSVNEPHEEKPNQAEPTSGSVASRLFGDSVSLAQDEDSGPSQTRDATPSEALDAAPTGELSAGDADLDFLESNDSGFGDDKAEEMNDAAPLPSLADDTSSTLDREDRFDPVFLAATTDITMDIQMNDNQNTDDSQWDGANEVAPSPVAENDVVPSESSEPNRAEVSDDHTTFTEAEDDVSGHSVSAEAVPTQNEDYDWLGGSNELDTEAKEADAFEQEMAAVSEDETDVLAEQAGASQDYDWSNTDAYDATMEEGAEAAEEVYDGETCETEEATEDAEVGENGHYVEDDVAAAEEPTEQFELGEGVDADDEEAETFGDWEKGFDPNSNHYFWFNHSSGESSWTPPEGWPYEVDEPFSAEDEVDAGEEQQEQALEEGAAHVQDEAETEAQEYDEGMTTESQCYEEGAGQVYEEAATEEQFDEEDTAEGQYYEEGAADGQYYEEGAADGQYDEGDAEGQETATEEQQYEEPAADGQWYDETVVEGEECAAETPSYEVATDDEQQAGEESPRRSEVSDFEFDDSDLPGF